MGWASPQRCKIGWAPALMPLPPFLSAEGEQCRAAVCPEHTHGEAYKWHRFVQLDPWENRKWSWEVLPPPRAKFRVAAHKGVQARKGVHGWGADGDARTRRWRVHGGASLLGVKLPQNPVVMGARGKAKHLTAMLHMGTSSGAKGPGQHLLPPGFADLATGNREDASHGDQQLHLPLPGGYPGICPQLQLFPSTHNPPNPSYRFLFIPIPAALSDGAGRGWGSSCTLKMQPWPGWHQRGLW